MTEERKRVPEYWWFQGPSVRELIWQLSQANPATAVLKCRPDADGKLWLSVLDGPQGATKIAIAGEINESENCPPNCLA